MATVYVTEFMVLQNTLSEPAQAVHGFPLAEQTVAITGASVQSAVVQADTHLVRVHTDAICSIKIGKNAVATTKSMRLAANQTEYFGVGQGEVVAVITNT